MITPMKITAGAISAQANQLSGSDLRRPVVVAGLIAAESAVSSAKSVPPGAGGGASRIAGVEE